MIIRIVKLSFDSKHISAFKTIFEENIQKIITQKGCQHIEILQDITNKNTFFTYSCWESEIDLNNYRESKLFKNIWNKTKILFNKKPKAWSTKKINEKML